MNAVYSQELEDRDKFMEALIHKYNVGTTKAPATIKAGDALPVDDAITILQRNERGRQVSMLCDCV